MLLILLVIYILVVRQWLCVVISIQAALSRRLLIVLTTFSAVICKDFA